MKETITNIGCSTWESAFLLHTFPFGYMPPVDTSWALDPILGPPRLSTGLLVAEYKC